MMTVQEIVEAQSKPSFGFGNYVVKPTHKDLIPPVAWTISKAKRISPIADFAKAHGKIPMTEANHRNWATNH
jgi:hypothetical protein